MPELLWTPHGTQFSVTVPSFYPTAITETHFFSITSPLCSKIDPALSKSSSYTLAFSLVPIPFFPLPKFQSLTLGIGNSAKPVRKIISFLLLWPFSNMKAAVTSSFELSSGRGEASGCVTGVLHWMLCRNLRDRRFTDEGEVVGSRREDHVKSEDVTTASSSPGIVARLMGLESLPAFPHAQPGTITRTRSANSAEAWKGPGLLAEPRGGNVGSELRKSQSFREVRSYLRKESEEFLVLSFGDNDESEALELNTKKLDDGFEQYGLKESRGERKLAEKKRSRNKSLVNSAEIKQSDVKSSVSPLVKHFSGSEKGMKPNETAERSSSCRKKISFGHEEMQLECSSQNSSPLSVLDLPLDADGDCLTSPDSCISVCEVSMLKSEEEDTRKKVSLEVEDESRKAGKCGLVTQNFSDIWALICSLGEDDLNNAKWVKARTVKSEEAEEIGFVVWQDMFELLLNEAVFDMFH